jgi:peroxiredoxin
MGLLVGVWILIVVFFVWQRFYFQQLKIFFMVLLESQVKLKTGDLAPDFDLIGIDDKKHSLNSYKEYEGLLVIFICNHCPYVKAKIEAIKEIHEKFKDKIAVVGINSNDPVNYPDDSFENMKKTAQEKSMKFDYLVDETQEIAKKYGALCTPDPFLFDKQMKLIFHGRIDNAMKPEDTATEKTMISNIEKYLSGEKIEKDFDPSIGCSIKWKEQQT